MNVENISGFISEIEMDIEPKSSRWIFKNLLIYTLSSLGNNELRKYIVLREELY